MQFNWILHTN